MSLLLFEKEAAAVNQAAEEAVQLIQKFASLEPPQQQPRDDNNDNNNDDNNSNNNPWKDPHEMFAALDEARNKLNRAWEDLQQAILLKEEENGSTSTNISNNFDKEQLRVAYMDMVTDAFADVLDSIREEEGDQLDVDVLVDVLQSGLDLISLEQDGELFMLQQQQQQERNDDDDEDTAVTDKTEEAAAAAVPVLTPHEMRRLQLGFHVETTTTA